MYSDFAPDRITIFFLFVACVSTVNVMNYAYGQPTIPEDPPWYVKSESCVNKDTVAMATALELLRMAVEQQGLDNRKLQEDVSSLTDHSAQVRRVLAQLVDTIHDLVTHLAAKYPCQCDLQDGY